jgi:hypothetical protein
MANRVGEECRRFLVKAFTEGVSLSSGERQCVRFATRGATYVLMKCLQSLPLALAGVSAADEEWGQIT